MNRKKILIFLMLLLCACPLFAGYDWGHSMNPRYVSSSDAQVSDVPNAQKMTWIKKDSSGKMIEIDALTNAFDGEVIGAAWYNSDGTLLKKEWYTRETRWLQNWIKYIGMAIDDVTMHIAMAIHPFPYIMYKMYSINLKVDPETDRPVYKFTPADPKFTSDKLLISSDYYTAPSGLDDNIADGMWVLDLTETPGVSGYESKQFSKWSIIAVLFITCFVAELLFTAVYGYATGSSESSQSLLKELAKKATITLALFILVSSLPFLLEAVRGGLFEIAKRFYGEAYTEFYAKMNQNDPLTKDTMIFNMPSLFMKSMGNLLVKSDSAPGESAFNEMMKGVGIEFDSEGSVAGWVFGGLKTFFIKLTVQVIYLVYRFVMFFVILKSTVHIARNIMEVYLLLGLTMILTPLAVFQPTKSVGAKCIMSLLTNLIECFVLLVIIITMVPAVKSAVNNIIRLEEAINADGTSYKREYKFSPQKIQDEKADYYGPSGNPNSYMQGDSAAAKISFDTKVWTVAVPGYLMAVTEVPGIQTRFAVVYSPEGNQVSEGTLPYFVLRNLTTDLYVTIDSKGSISDMKEIEYAKNNGKLDYSYDRGKLHIETEGNRDNSIDINKYAAGWKQVFELFTKFNNNEADWQMFIESDDFRQYTLDASIDAALKYQGNASVNFMGAIYEGGLFQNIGNGDGWYYTMTGSGPFETIDNLITYSPVERMFTLLTLIFMGLYIPCFFIQQSTMITNSLMNGSAGMESLGNALSSSMNSMNRMMAGIVSPIGNIARTAVTGSSTNSLIGTGMYNATHHGGDGGGGQKPNEGSVAGSMQNQT